MSSRACEGRRGNFISSTAIICAGRRVVRIAATGKGRALLEADAACARVAVIEDIGDVDICEFWRRMDERGWAHPYDRQGQRRAMTAIPASLAMLEDDPYRTLAGVLRREKAYAKADLPFEEFAWANFLRSRIPAELIRTNFADAGSLAMTLAASQEARHLPGWIGQVR